MFICDPIVIVDGDTIRCGEERVRLIGIDAPELPGHCRKPRVCTPGDGAGSKQVLASITDKGTAQCERLGFDKYGRTLARCIIGTISMGCEMVRLGAAVPRYGGKC